MEKVEWHTTEKSLAAADAKHEKSFSSDCFDGFYASKFFAKFDKGYIKYRSFDNGRTCEVYSRTDSKNNFTVTTYNISYRSRGSMPKDIKTQVRSFQVQSRPNLVLLKNDDDSLAANLTVIYSEPGKCAIFRGNTNPSQCTLYVLTNTSDADINRCESFFPRFCGSQLYTGLTPSQCLGR
ncbi:uncharacterized protein ISCGN_017539 [Ixodes scapularis]